MSESNNNWIKGFINANAEFQNEIMWANLWMSKTKYFQPSEKELAEVTRLLKDSANKIKNLNTWIKKRYIDNKGYIDSKNAEEINKNKILKGTPYDSKISKKGVIIH